MELARYNFPKSAQGIVINILADMFKNRVHTFLFFVFFAMLYALRFFWIDTDLPPWGMTCYHPIDEGLYAMGALNRYIYGAFEPDGAMIQANFRNGIFQTTMASLGLNVFGKTYMGLRSGSVLIMFISSLMLIHIVGYVLECSKMSVAKKNLLRLLISAICLVDFPMTIASKAFEPSAYRLFFCLACMCLFIQIEKSQRIVCIDIAYFFLGFLSIFSVFGCYITNIFLPIAVFVAILVLNLKEGTLPRSCLLFLVGGSIAFFICDAFYAYYFHSSCISNAIEIVHDFSGKVRYDVIPSNSLFKKIIYSSFHFMCANSNLYNIPIIVFAWSLFPLSFADAIRKKSVMIAIHIIYLMFFIQTAINEDYIVKKEIIVYPLLLVIFFQDCAISFVESKNKYLKWLYRGWCFAVILAVGVIAAYRLYMIGDGTNLDFTTADRTTICVSALVSIIVFIAYYRDKIICPFAKHTKYYIMALFITVLVNSFLVINHIYLNPTYSEKEAMIKIGKDVGENRVYGSYMYGFVLYNDIKPFWNKRDGLIKTLENKDGLFYYLDYSDFHFPLARRKNFKWSEIQVYPRRFPMRGVNHSVSLYIGESE